MRRLTREEKYALWRSVLPKELAEERCEEEMTRSQLVKLIKNYLESVDEDEARLCTKWKMIWKVARED